MTNNTTTPTLEIDPHTTAAQIRQYINETPTIGIVLGSGLGALAEEIEDAVTIPYSTMQGFKTSTTSGHKGNLVIGQLGGKQVIAMQGRFHYYEGYTMREVTFPIRVMKCLGVETLFVSNAAGAVNTDYRVGDLMIIRDHINQLPNPLIGANDERFGSRFPDMTCTYDRELRELAQQIGKSNNITLHSGVYVGLTGPSYETPAEYEFYRRGGGDAIGMSTIPEVIVARHAGIRIFGISVITNEAAALSEEKLNDEQEVIEAANKASQHMTLIIRQMINNIK